jgi:hypothetical protein
MGSPVQTHVSKTRGSSLRFEGLFLKLKKGGGWGIVKFWSIRLLITVQYRNYES